MKTIAHTWTRARALVCVFLLCLVGLAHAEGTIPFPPVQYMVGAGGNPADPQWGPTLDLTRAGACAKAPPRFGATASPPPGPYGGGTLVNSNTQCNITYNGGASSANVSVYQINPSCPPNSTGPNGTAPNQTCTCGAGTSPADGNTACVSSNACTAGNGLSQITNYTVGWVKNPNAEPVDSVANMVGDYKGPKIGDNQCMAGCKRNVYGLAPSTKGFVSLEAGPTGLYRMSLDFVTVGMGVTCTAGASDAAGDPNTAPPACPGVMGMVNGVMKCLASSPSTPLPAPSNSASAPPAGTPYTPGNPAAGDKPSTGPGAGDGGAGRTPVSGNGSNNGGSSSASTGQLGGSGVGGGGSNTAGAGGAGTGSTGDGTKPRDPCGLPGTPACKLDETGTPNGQGVYDGATTVLNTSKTNALSGIDGVAGISTNRSNGGFGTGWFPVVPSSCTNPPGIASAYGFTLDICAYRPMIWDLMSIVWVAAALIGCAWIMYDTLSKGG